MWSVLAQSNSHIQASKTLVHKPMGDVKLALSTFYHLVYTMNTCQFRLFPPLTAMWIYLNFVIVLLTCLNSKYVSTQATWKCHYLNETKQKPFIVNTKQRCRQEAGCKQMECLSVNPVRSKVSPQVSTNAQNKDCCDLMMTYNKLIIQLERD